MAKPPLRAVSPDDPPPAKCPSLSLVDAIEQGDYREILLAQRREIARSLPDERGPAKAALHRQLSLISKEIEALDAREIDDDDDAIIPDEAWGTG